MAKKTKAELERELRTEKREARLWKGHAKKAQDGELEAFRQLEALERELKELNKELKECKKDSAYYEVEYRKFCVQSQELLDELNNCKGERDIFRDQYDQLMEKHDTFVLKHRTICEEHSRQVDTLRENLHDASQELVQAKAKIAAQEGRLMVAETVMQSMTIHIHLLTNQKGKNNA